MSRFHQIQGLALEALVIMKELQSSPMEYLSLLPPDQRQQFSDEISAVQEKKDHDDSFFGAFIAIIKIVSKHEALRKEFGLQEFSFKNEQLKYDPRLSVENLERMANEYKKKDKSIDFLENEIIDLKTKVKEAVSQNNDQYNSRNDD